MGKYFRIKGKPGNFRIFPTKRASKEKEKLEIAYRMTCIRNRQSFPTYPTAQQASSLLGYAFQQGESYGGNSSS
ncbi:MAG: hypothetical protein UU72_C0007G0006 [candidate division WWE3 bacterium GW2011_GWB1_41_6]|uniref:Uncharacterized protein n=1 Tax=candidate division WWE3 bacterium GW2011_GWB1_41_6 TaxID=1619112 RepID=A0A0G0Z4W2_UNCKA|nr:MAG: hypothetical protein UU72_C0007G0006 [candidate division WWE3 bacterium GW2011_GWB1_41_6]